MVDTVGAVYVKVRSDSSGFRKEVQRDASAAGKSAAKAFSTEFDADVNRDFRRVNLAEAARPQMKKMGRELADRIKAATRNGAVIEFNLEKAIPEAEIKRMSRQLGVPFEELADYIKTEMPRALEQGFEDIRRDAAKAAKDMERDQKKEAANVLRLARNEYTIHQRLAALRDKDSKKRVADLLKFGKIQYSMHNRLAALRKKEAADQRKEYSKIRPLAKVIDTAAFDTTIRYMTKQFATKVTPALGKSLLDGTKIDWTLDRDAYRQIELLARTFRISMGDATRIWDRDLRTRLRNINDARWFNRLSNGLRDVRLESTKFDKTVQGWALRLRLAGQRSRTWLGGVSLGLASLLTLSQSLGKALVTPFLLGTKAISGFGKFLSSFSDSANPFLKTLSGMGVNVTKFGEAATAAFKSPLGVLVGLGGALAAAQSLIGILVVIANAAAAAFVMLGAAIYAVVVQLALLAPLAGALAVGFGAVVVGALDAAGAVGKLAAAMNETDPKKRAEAFKEYEEALAKLGPEARKAVRALKPLIEGFADLKKTIGEALFAGLGKEIRELRSVAKPLETGLVAIATAVNSVIKEFLNLAENTAFMRDFNIMMRTSAVIIEDLGSAAASVFSGLTSFFAALSPLIERFTGNIAKSAKEFEKWAQDPENQEKILKFFEDAARVAGQVWDVLVQLVGLFSDLFTAGATENATVGALEEIEGWLRRARDKIKEWQEDGTLQEWFRKAKDVAFILWGVIKAVGSALQRLNTPENVQMFKDAARFVGILIGLFNVLMWTGARVRDVLAAMFGPGIRMAKNFIGWIKTALEWVTKLLRKVGLLDKSRPSGGGGGSWAAGGVAWTPTRKMIGEAGPEAVIPMHRPLSMISPSVRDMAAAIRGSDGAFSPSVGGGGPQMVNHWNVSTPNPDGRVVASQVINRLATAAG